MTTQTSGPLDDVLEAVEQIYQGLFDDGDTQQASAAFDALLQGLLQKVRGAELEPAEHLEALHIVADVAAELGRVADVRFAAGALARHFEPEDDEDLVTLVEDMISDWRCPEAALHLIERLEGQVDAEVLQEQRELIEEDRVATAAFPLTSPQVLALRRQLLKEEAVVEEPDGFLVEDDEEQPFKRTEAWLRTQGLDPEPVLAYLRAEADCTSDPDVLLSLQPPELYDALAHWDVEALARRYWMGAAAGAAQHGDEWAEESPDGSRMAIFDDDERVAFLYVYDTEDEELVVPPLWLYNRAPAPADGVAQDASEGRAPLMPASFVQNPAPMTDEVSELELLWSSDSKWVAVKVNGALVGVADVEQGKAYSCGLKQPSDLGLPMPADLPFPPK